MLFSTPKKESALIFNYMAYQRYVYDTEHNIKVFPEKWEVGRKNSAIKAVNVILRHLFTLTALNHSKILGIIYNFQEIRSGIGSFDTSPR